MKRSGLVRSRILSVLTVLSFMSLQLVGSAAGDGGIIGKSGTLFYLGQDSQYAVIDYSNGVQKMLVSINFPWKDSTNTAWIFPLPSDPGTIDVDIADGAPILSGTDVVEEAKEEIGDAVAFFAVSYPLSVAIPWPLTLIYFSSGGLIGGTTGGTVHKHLEKYGFVVEVISATEGAGIYDHLTINGLEVSEGIIPQLDDYVQANYTFVVTWVEDSGTWVREPGLIVSFPTDEMFYPLILTSIYGHRVIPMDLYVSGHVSPIIYSGIRPYTEVRHWRGELSRYDPYDASPEVAGFISDMRRGWDGTFTTIVLSAPSNAFTEDLWIEDEVPDTVRRANAIHEFIGGGNFILLFLVLFVVASPLVGLAIGAVVLGWRKDALPNYMTMGMGNALGIVGLIMATILVREKMNFSWWKGFSFIVWFSVAFLAIFLAFLGMLYLAFL